jgi:hypothetical protein
MRTLGCFLLRRNMKVRMANSPVPHGFFFVSAAIR